MRLLLLPLLPFLLAVHQSAAQFGPAQLVAAAGSGAGLVQAQVLITSDINADGRLDIVHAGGNFNSNILRYFSSLPGGGFSAAQPVTGPFTQISDIALADHNADGRPDLLVADRAAAKVYLYFNSAGTFPARITISDPKLTASHVSNVISRDFTADGTPDLVILNHIDAILFRGLGGGAFDTGVSIVPAALQTEFYHIVAGRFNNDTFPDLAIASSGFQTFLNNGTGTFAAAAATPGSITTFMSAGDMNGDGLDDIAAMVFTTGKVYLSTGTGSYGLPTALKPSNASYRGFSIADMDGDGDGDLYAVYDQQNRAVWFKNMGAGVLDSQQVIHAETPGSMAACALADLDGDAKLDPIWVNSNGRIGYHLNGHPASVGSTAGKVGAVRVYPNPARGELWIEMLESGTMEVMDVAGRVLLMGSMQRGRNHVVVHLPAGVYSLRVHSKQGTVSRPLIIVE